MISGCNFHATFTRYFDIGGSEGVRKMLETGLDNYSSGSQSLFTDVFSEDTLEDLFKTTRELVKPGSSGVMSLFPNSDNIWDESEGAGAEFCSANDTKGSKDLASKVATFDALLKLMDYMEHFDFDKDANENAKKEPKLTEDELKRAQFRFHEPENEDLAKAAKYALDHFKKLTGGDNELTREHLKQPLVKALCDVIKTGANSKDGLPTEVKEAIALYVGMPTDSPQALQDKINKALEGSGLKLKISSSKIKGVSGEDIPVTSVSIDSEKGSETFAYASKSKAGDLWSDAKEIKNDLVVLDDNVLKKYAKGDSPVTGHLDTFRKLNSLRGKSTYADRDNNKVLTKPELADYASDDPAIKFAIENFAKLAKTQMKGEKATVTLNDIQSVIKLKPELKADLEFLAKVFKMPGVSVKQIEEFMKKTEKTQQSPLSKEFTIYDDLTKTSGQKREEGIEKLAGKVKDIKALIDGFDKLEKDFGCSKDEGSRPGLQKLLAEKKDLDPDLKKAIQATSYLKGDGQNFSRKALEKAVDELKGKPKLFDFEKEELASLEFALTNFEKIREMSLPKEASIDLSKLAGDKVANEFLKNKNNHYAMDKNGDGRVTKSELEDLAKYYEKELARETEIQAEEQKMYKEAMERFKSISKNLGELVKATGGDEPGISLAELDEQMFEELGKCLKSWVGENGATLPGPIKEALSRGIGVRSEEELKTISENLNKILKGSGYQIELSVANTDGPHGPSVRTTTVCLFNAQTPKNRSTFVFSFDTLRGRGR